MVTCEGKNMPEIGARETSTQLKARTLYIACMHKILQVPAVVARHRTRSFLVFVLKVLWRRIIWTWTSGYAWRRKRPCYIRLRATSFLTPTAKGNYLSPKFIQADASLHETLVARFPPAHHQSQSIA